MNWEISTTEGTAAAFHDRDPESDTGHQVWTHRLQGPALVLGSTQPDELVRRERAEADGIEVCRRRSGGGLVFINPETDCWVDVIVPHSSPLWDDDVARAFHWLGELWATVISELIADAAANNHAPSPVVHRASAATAVGRVWCFADLGHGEVSLQGSKVLGLSQRRTRTWLRLQGLLLGAWPGDRLLPYVDLDYLVENHPERFGNAELLRPGHLAAGFPAEVAAPSPADTTARFTSAIQQQFSNQDR
ncbi:MAG: lipoyl protein ligase domain-containing protein [Acidimicrobiales bacterium]